VRIAPLGRPSGILVRVGIEALRGAYVRVLRNIFRRKLRAFLTIFGIAIGVFALVVMGSIAEKLTLLVDGGVKYYQGKVVIVPKVNGATGSSNMLTVSKRRDLERVHGVAAISTEISAQLTTETITVSFGPPPSIAGSDGKGDNYETYKLTYSEGRELKPWENGKVAVGSDLVKKLDAKVGGTVKIRGKYYQVVGIADKTMSAPDTTVMMTLADSQEIAAEDLPDLIKDTVNPKTLVSDFAIYPTEGTQPEVLAAAIKRKLDDVDAYTAKEFEQQIKAPLQIFTTIIYAIGAISLLVGGLSVINTMTMSVAERTREIGIRKAIGASDGQIMAQFILESGVIGLLGGLGGLALGLLVAAAGNAAGQASGNALFLVTPRLMLASVGFAVVLGIVSGLYPAWHAARLNPVEALRYE
jgi:putative ABC transport system permease protein